MTAFPSELDSDYHLPICNTVQSYTLSKKPLPERISAGGSDLLQHSLRITGCDARHLPEKPSLGRSSHLAHSNQAVRWRLLQPPLPSRDHHRRAIQPLSESQLIQPKFLSQCPNPPRPCGQGSSHELAGPGHICLQDNKLSPTLHAHTFAPPPTCRSLDQIRRQFDNQGGRPASAEESRVAHLAPSSQYSTRNPLIAIYYLW